MERKFSSEFPGDENSMSLELAGSANKKEHVNDQEDLSDTAKEWKNKNFYDRLGVSKNATDAEINSAFKRLSIKYHPDKFLDSQEKLNAEEVQKLLSEAKTTLLDLDARELYNPEDESSKIEEKNIATKFSLTVFDKRFDLHGFKYIKEQLELSIAKGVTKERLLESSFQGFDGYLFELIQRKGFILAAPLFAKRMSDIGLLEIYSKKIKEDCPGISNQTYATDLIHRELDKIMKDPDILEKYAQTMEAFKILGLDIERDDFTIQPRTNGGSKYYHVANHIFTYYLRPYKTDPNKYTQLNKILEVYSDFGYEREEIIKQLVNYKDAFDKRQDKIDPSKLSKSDI